MLLNRKNKKDAGSLLEVILTQQELMEWDPTLTISIRNRLVDMGMNSDTKFAVVSECSQHIVFGSFSNDRHKLKAAVTQALVDMRMHLNPKKASDVFVRALLPPGLAHKISMQ